MSAVPGAMRPGAIWPGDSALSLIGPAAVYTLGAAAFQWEAGEAASRWETGSPVFQWATGEPYLS